MLSVAAVGDAPAAYGVGAGVGVGAQPVAVQASQQLEKPPTHAEPPDGGVQWSASRFVEHFVAPFALVRQQVTKPGFPHVDRAAHRWIAPLQLGAS